MPVETLPRQQQDRLPGRTVRGRRAPQTNPTVPDEAASEYEREIDRLDAAVFERI